MKVLGLTGSIATGKSEAANAFAKRGAAVFSADAAVHELLGHDAGIIAAVGDLIAGTVRNAAIDRGALGARVFDDPAALAQLEQILHPAVRRAELVFLGAAWRARTPLAVLEIPLLYETGADEFCDAVAVTTVPLAEQRARALARPGMNAAKLAGILGRQMPDAEKRRRATFVIATGRGRHYMLRQIREIVETLVS